MKTYEPSTIVELGNASALVLGEDGEPADSPIPFPPQPVGTLLDTDE